MQKANGTKALRSREVIAYGCTGIAAIFILALTMGMFEPSEAPRHMASNATGSAVVSTP